MAAVERKTDHKTASVAASVAVAAPASWTAALAGLPVATVGAGAVLGGVGAWAFSSLNRYSQENAYLEVRLLEPAHSVPPAVRVHCLELEKLGERALDPATCRKLARELEVELDKFYARYDAHARQFGKSRTVPPRAVDLLLCVEKTVGGILTKLAMRLLADDAERADKAMGAVRMDLGRAINTVCDFSKASK